MIPTTCTRGTEYADLSAMPPTRKTKFISKTVVTHWLNMATQERGKAAKACHKKSTLAKPCHFAPIAPAPNSSSVACATLPNKKHVAAKSSVTTKTAVAIKNCVTRKTVVAPREPTALGLASMPVLNIPLDSSCEYASTPVSYEYASTPASSCEYASTPASYEYASTPVSYDDTATPVRPMLVTP